MPAYLNNNGNLRLSCMAYVKTRLLRSLLQHQNKIVEQDETTLNLFHLLFLCVCCLNDAGLLSVIA